MREHHPDRDTLERLSGQEEDQVWARLLSKLEHRRLTIARERAVALRLVEQILAAPPWTREALIRSKGRFRTAAVCELLIDRSFAAGFEDPAQARELAELAIEVADGLDPARYGISVMQDFRARAWAYLGHATRLGSDLDGAEEAVSVAELLWEEGSADLLEEARLLELKASLLADRGRLEEAAGLLDASVDIFESCGGSPWRGRFYP